MVTIGKAIGGGIPVGAYGLSAELAATLTGRADLDLVDMGGVGGTLAGNPVSMAATRATLEEVLTDAAFAGMIEVGDACSPPASQKIIDGVRACRGRSASSAPASSTASPRPRRAPAPSRPPAPTPSWRTSCTSSCSTGASC